MKHDFRERLNFSQGVRGERDAEILKQAIPNCVEVRKTDEEVDRKGVDYTATLEGGAEIGIDVKTRDKGASKYWEHGQEELALEIWSVKPDGENKGKIGWTLSDKTNVDLILYTFDEADSGKYYLFPYQFLRMAFRRNGREWVKKYRKKRQNSGKWSSEAVFVPAGEVIKAVMSEMQGNLIQEAEGG